MKTLFILLLTLPRSAHAITIKVLDIGGKPLSTVMVTQSLMNAATLDTSDHGFPKPNTPYHADTEITGFTNSKGQISFPDIKAELTFRFRKTSLIDAHLNTSPGQKSALVKMELENDPFNLAAAKPANVWLSALDVGTADDKTVFKMQCTFCHQQGSFFTRQERSPDEWEKLIKRMVRYGSRLPTALQKTIPQKLSESYRSLRENPKLLGESAPWSESLSKLTITEWPIGSAMSQTHDMLIAQNKMIYVGDNIQDRLYEVDPKTNKISVYKIPHRDGEGAGGLLGARLKEFPSHDSTSNAHSLTESQKDGHIFITPSAQRRLVEFDPKTKAFTLHDFKVGFYPHTIRMDAHDNVWFTLALSNQVAKYDRAADKFTLFDLPSRSFKEKLITQNIGFLFKIMGWGIPLSNLLKIDRESIGTPLLYGIDVTPDGKIWFARLHSREIGCLDPETGKITMIPTPFEGPRRLRTDADGNLWVTSFGESKIARYEPKNGKFFLFDLPVSPKGSDTPYSLNFDKKRNMIWVNGNQSDALYGLNIKTETWNTIPLPKRVTFTRDVEIDEDGTIYTANSNFPSWHIEGTQPTLIQIRNF